MAQRGLISSALINAVRPELIHVNTQQRSCTHAIPLTHIKQQVNMCVFLCEGNQSGLHTFTTFVIDHVLGLLTFPHVHLQYE